MVVSYTERWQSIRLISARTAKRKEREAYEEGNMMLRNWEDNIKAKKYLKEYKQYVLTELFEKDLPNIEKLNSYEYKVGNGDDI